ncbi:MAG: hypothetical protein ACM3O4_01875 [Ignavibacteriales bacterium]
MKKIIYFIFTVCVIGLFNSTVEASEWDPNLGGDGDTNYTGSCAGKDSCWLDQWGYRVSLVDASGNQITTTSKGASVSMDYLSATLGEAYSVAAKPTRFEVLRGTVADSFTYGTYYQKKTGISDYYNKGKNTTVEDYFKGILKASDESAEQLLLADLNVNLEDAKTICGTTKLYLLIEPLFVIRGGSDRYVGTGTEIARLIYNNNYTWIKSIVYKGTIPLSITTPNAISGSPVIPVSSFTTGSGSADVNKVRFASGSNIYGYAMGYFSFNEYIDCTVKQPPSYCELHPNDLPTCCYLSQNVNKLPECCGLAENQGKPGCVPDLCTFDLDVSITNNCNKGTTGYVNDINDWDCIFASRTSSVANIKNHFYEWENRYCSIFCREAISYEFPDDNMSVFAGRRFTLGLSGFTPSLSPIAFTGRSECRTTSSTGNIRWDLFKTDWASANTVVKNTWDAYQVEVKKDDGIAAYIQSATKNCANYCDNNVHGIECCITADRDWNECRYGSSCGSKDSKGNCINTCTAGWDPWYCVDDDTPYDHGYTRTPSTQYYTNTDNVTLTINTSSWCTSCGNSFRSTKCTPDTTYTASRRSDYNNALATRDGYLRTLKECNNFQRTYNDFHPVTFFKYEEAIYGGKTYQLADNLDTRSQTNFFYNTSYASRIWETSSYLNNPSEFIYDYSNNGRTDVIAKWVCDTLRLKCYSVNETYPINTMIKQFTTKEYDYVLPRNVYRFIDKPSGESYDYSPGPNSYDIGYSNLPVHYSREPGSYDFTIDYKTFGPNHKFNKFIFEGAYVDISYGEDLSIYSFLWNNTTLNRLINDCEQGGHHLGHSFVSQIGGRLGEFLASGCAQTYGCVQQGSLVQCNKYQDTYGTWRTASGSSYYTVYNQLRACVQSKVVSTTGSVAFNEDTKYECTYNVQNRVMCPPGDCDEQVGLSVVYRDINLSDPFPGINGTGRTPGNNWNISYYINTYITNNRGVTTDRVYYDRDPLYKITLTPAIIKSIRQYNQREVQLNDGYADFAMSCLNNGTKCLSGFIREGSFTNLFSGCGISGKQINPSRCAANEAW